MLLSEAMEKKKSKTQITSGFLTIIFMGSLISNLGFAGFEFVDSKKEESKEAVSTLPVKNEFELNSKLNSTSSQKKSSTIEQEVWTRSFAAPYRDADSDRDSGGGVEFWKGAPPRSDIHLGVLTGLGIIDSELGWSLIGSAAPRLFDRGFVPDINNEVFIELQFGLLFSSGTSVFLASHLRWDFHRDSRWALFGLGGFSLISTSTDLGSRSRFSPRFGVGVIRMIAARIGVRAEITHNTVLVGSNFYF